MGVTNYQRGAIFERKVLAYLRGEDNTEATSGYLHSLIPAIYTTLQPKEPPYPKITGVRVAGSRGDYDILINTAWTFLHGTAVLGVQCKLTPPSYKTMIGDLTRIYRDTGVVGVYAVKHNGKVAFVPNLDNVYATLIQGVLGE